MNGMRSQAAPPGWGQDHLTQYLDGYRGNQYATFANKSSEVTDLISIDYGAHPNERGVSLSSRAVDIEADGKQFLTIYLHSDGLGLDYGLKSAAQVGLWALRIAQEIYPTRTHDLGLKHQITDMSKRL